MMKGNRKVTWTGGLSSPFQWARSRWAALVLFFTLRYDQEKQTTPLWKRTCSLYQLRKNLRVIRKFIYLRMPQTSKIATVRSVHRSARFTKKMISSGKVPCARLSVSGNERNSGRAAKKEAQREAPTPNLSPAPTHFLRWFVFRSAFPTILEPGTG